MQPELLTRVFPADASGKESICQCQRGRRCEFDPWVGKIPWSRKWQPIPVFLHGQFPWTEEPGRLHGAAKSQTRLSTKAYLVWSECNLLCFLLIFFECLSMCLFLLLDCEILEEELYLIIQTHRLSILPMINRPKEYVKEQIKITVETKILEVLNKGESKKEKGLLSQLPNPS